MKWDIVGLIGKYEHTIDANGRLSIPAKFRDYLMECSEGTMVMTTVSKDSCVVVYPLPSWQIITERAAKMSPQPGEPLKDFLSKKDFFKIVSSKATDCSLDPHGRILLPAHLRADGGLTKDVVLVGNRNAFEIWDKQRWQENEVNVFEAFQDPEKMQEAMAILSL